MSEQQTQQRDVKQIVSHLTRVFNQATSKLEKPNRPKDGPANETYIMQTEFAYIINEIMMQPQAAIQPWIAKANEHIDAAMLAARSKSRAK